MTTALTTTNNNTDLVKSSWDALSVNTRQAYQTDFDQFIKFVKKDFVAVQPDDILKYVKYLRERGLKNSTINRKIASISKLFMVYVQAGKMGINPVALVRTMRGTSYKTQRNVKSSIDLKTLKKALDRPKGEDVKTVLITRFLAKTGCRISEALTAKRSDIVPHSKKNYKIMVFGKGRKERHVFIDKKFKDEIYKNFPENALDLLFISERGRQINRSSFYSVMVNFFKRKTGLHINPHKLRHFYATHKIYKEKSDIKSVSKFLGHANVSTTLEMYVDAALDEKEAAIDL
jgi:site-specific recombinase XerD